MCLCIVFQTPQDLVKNSVCCLETTTQRKRQSIMWLSNMPVKLPLGSGYVPEQISLLTFHSKIASTNSLSSVCLSNKKTKQIYILQDKKDKNMKCEAKELRRACSFPLSFCFENQSGENQEQRDDCFTEKLRSDLLTIYELEKGVFLSLKFQNCVFFASDKTESHTKKSETLSDLLASLRQTTIF